MIVLVRVELSAAGGSFWEPSDGAPGGVSLTKKMEGLRPYLVADLFFSSRLGKLEALLLSSDVGTE